MVFLHIPISHFPFNRLLSILNSVDRDLTVDLAAAFYTTKEFKNPKSNLEEITRVSAFNL